LEKNYGTYSKNLKTPQKKNHSIIKQASNYHPSINMKLNITSSVVLATLLVAAAAVDAAAPDCQVNDVEGYGNCKRSFQVAGSGSDVLWCKTEADCLKVFQEQSPPPITSEESVPIKVDAIEEQLESSSTTLKTKVVSGAVVVTTSMMMILC
jgi:hypothetical protein